KPVLLLHGTPASRITFAFADEPARKLGVRAIAPDRPGIGLSDDQPNRGILDYPHDIAELGDKLGLDSFSVLGWAGGGPYALACGAVLADRVKAVAVVSGMAPLEYVGSLEGFGRTERQALRLTHVAPWIAKPFYRYLARLVRWQPGLAVTMIRHSLSPNDQQLLGEPDPEQVMAFFLEACRQGSRGVVLDYRLFTFPWGFEVEDLTVPVHIFHGDDDRTIPYRHAEILAERIPGATLTTWHGEGHLALWRHATEVLEAIT
ncbi:MAG: alpha/beta hydrolase, partial [Acidimicrobiales bacterium]|nr:alpha/beta hydrolase [Acidimicrobiales bacterium]